jgi:uncharacterized radical SAM superfamily protein
VSDNLINPQDKNSPADRYYKKIWETMGAGGYVKPEHYWEIPAWIAEIDGMVEYNPDVQTALYHIDDLSGAVPPGYDYYLASVLDCNKDILAKVVEKNHSAHFILGGYIGLEDFIETFKNGYNVIWANSLQLFCCEMQRMGHNINYSRSVSYRLFRNMECIPRLALSDGCKHNCNFCSIPNKVTERSHEEIKEQIESFRDLIFERVYINDKTFGQASNWKDLRYIYNSIKKFLPDFEGFTIQTSAITMVEFMLNDIDLKYYGIRTVEIGVESFNNDIYVQYHKPQNTATVNTCMDYLKGQGVEIIPNIIIGLPGETIETYANTIRWLGDNRHLFLMFNVTNFVPYEGTKANEGMVKESGDTNQTVTERSWMTKKETEAALAFADVLFEMGEELLERNYRIYNHS